MKDIAIYGAGGFGREMACYIERVNLFTSEWNLIGYFDDGIPKGSETQYGPILGGKQELNDWKNSISIVFAIGMPKTIKKIVEGITSTKVTFPNIIDPSVCFIDKSSFKMGQGNVIGPNSLISCNVSLGNFNLLNVFEQIGHDTCLGDYNILMPTVNISGGVEIGNYNLFGVKSTVLQYLHIGDNVTLGPGSVLMKDTKNDTTYMGIPARPLFSK